MSPRRAAALLAALAAFLCGTTAAHAATAQVVDGATEDDWPELRYVAGPGEVNDPAVAIDEWEGDEPTVVQLSDPGAAIAPGPGCVAAGPHAVTCTIPTGVIVRLQLGDHDDRFASGAEVVVEGGPGNDVLDGSAWRVFSEELRGADGTVLDVPSLDGGAGDDRLLGGSGADVLTGGPGLDVLLGGRSGDWLADGDGAAPAADVVDGGGGRDTLSYGGRATPVTVDLTLDGPVQGGAREGDETRSIEHAAGGDADDTLAGDEHGNALFGGPGDDVLAGGAGADELRPGRGANGTDGGDGNDRIVATAPDDGPELVLGGAGNDSIDLAADARTVDAGAGDDAVWGAAVMGGTAIRCGAGDDFYRGELTRTVTLPGVLLRRDCEGYGDLPARPRVTREAVVFRLPCLEGEFDYADYTCRGRLRLAVGGRVLGERSFTARNARRRTLSFPRAGRLARAIRRHAPLRVELAGYREVESDFGKDRRGTLVWRITL